MAKPFVITQTKERTVAGDILNNGRVLLVIRNRESNGADSTRVFTLTSEELSAIYAKVFN